MKNNSGLTILVLTAAALSAFASAAQSQAQNSSPRTTQIQVGPSYDDLVDKLRDLRERKKYDWAHGRKYQDYLAKKIEIVKQALRNHHGPGGQKAAQNQGGDYSPPR